VHLYAIASDLPWLDERSLSSAVATRAPELGLDPSTAWSLRSQSARLVAAGVHHAWGRCGPRKYTSLTASGATWFDGLPVHADEHIDARDAAALAANWSALEQTLEGQFSAVHLDLAAESAELQTDALGMNEVFYARRGSGLLVSNSATLVASVLELSAPDPLGVSSFLALGWATGESTLVRGVQVLSGGSRYTIAGGRLQRRQTFGTATIPSGTLHGPASAGELADELTRLAAGAALGIEDVGCALTAGRDTRVLAALLQNTDADVLYFTGGAPETPDVVIAKELAELLGVRHEVVTHDPASRTRDWTHAAALFVLQTDGLSSLLQLPDYVDKDVPRALGVKLTGVGGEIGRAGTGPLTAIATNAPLVRRSVGVQRKLLGMKVRNEAGLLTADGVLEIERFLGGFQQERLDEGWRPEQIQEAFYTFERVGRWGATGVRRVAVTDDVFAPFCSRPFVNYCFSLSSAERYIEAAHYRLLGELSPSLRDHRFEVPFRPQHAWLVPAFATRELLGLGWERLGPRVRIGRPGTRAEPAVRATYPFQHAWFESRLGLIRELFAVPDSELWSFVSRTRVQELLEGDEAERARHQEDLLRATTVFWHFHDHGSRRHATELEPSTDQAVMP
jgi:asparagine synthase (glutamine-hydrolysing)